MDSSQVKCMRSLPVNECVNTTSEKTFNRNINTSTPRREKTDMAHILFMKLFASNSPKGKSYNKTIAEQKLMNSDDESLTEDDVINLLVSRVKLVSDDSSVESECNEDFEQFITSCLLDTDWERIEGNLKNYLKQNKLQMSLVEALRVIRQLAQGNVRRRLKKIVMAFYNTDELMKTIKSGLRSQKNCETVDEINVETTVNAEEESPNGNNEHGRRSRRVLSHPPGYFQTKSRSISSIELLPEELKYVETKKRKSLSTPRKVSAKKKKMKKVGIENESIKSAAPTSTNTSNVDDINDKENSRHSREVYPRSSHKKSEQKMKMANKSGPKMNFNKHKVTTADPDQDESIFGRQIRTNDLSLQEFCSYINTGRCVKRRSRISAPNLSPPHTAKKEDENRRKSTRLSSHPPGYFQTKPKMEYYIYCLDSNEKDTTKKKSTAKGFRKLFFGDI